MEFENTAPYKVLPIKLEDIKFASLKSTPNNLQSKKSELENFNVKNEV